MIGKFLKHRREAKGLTQDYVAHCLNVSRQAISNWENGNRDINIRDLISYAKLLEISFEDLEIHINHFANVDGPIETSVTARKLPEHFNFELRKSNKNLPSIKRIKIEGDKVIGVHLLLTSLFFDKQELVIKNCPTALEFLNILYEFGNNEWVESTINNDVASLIPKKTPYDIITLNKVSRASIGIVSALTYKYHKLLFTFPGGDDFCVRPINLHLDILSTVATFQHDTIANSFYSERNDLLILNKNQK